MLYISYGGVSDYYKFIEPTPNPETWVIRISKGGEFIFRDIINQENHEEYFTNVDDVVAFLELQEVESMEQILKEVVEFVDFSKFAK